MVFECRFVVVAAVAIGSIKIAMKTGSFPTLFPLARIDADEEMRRLGLANVLAACAGATGQAFSFSALKLAQQLGASSFGAGMWTPVAFLTAWLAGFGALQHVPRFVYGALLLDLGCDYVETYLWAPLAFRRRDVHADEAVAILAIVLTAALTSLLEAVGVGLVLCLVVTTRRLAAISVVVATHDARDARSTAERAPRQRRALDAQGAAIQLLTHSAAWSQRPAAKRASLYTLESVLRSG